MPRSLQTSRHYRAGDHRHLQPLLLATQRFPVDGITKKLDSFIGENGETVRFASTADAARLEKIQVDRPVVAGLFNVTAEEAVDQGQSQRFRLRPDDNSPNMTQPINRLA